MDMESGGKQAQTSVEQTDLRTLIVHSERMRADHTLNEVYQWFNTNTHDYCAVMAEGRLLGLCSRVRVGFLMGHRFGFAIYGRQLIRDHLMERPTIITLGTPLREVLEATLRRSGNDFGDDVALVGRDGGYLGMINVMSLVHLQSMLVEEKFRVQELMRSQLIESSRRAGMSEVTTGVLHPALEVFVDIETSIKTKP